jgi:hypothetical protein
VNSAAAATITTAEMIICRIVIEDLSFKRLVVKLRSFTLLRITLH